MYGYVEEMKKKISIFLLKFVNRIKDLEDECEM